MRLRPWGSVGLIGLVLFYVALFVDGAEKFVAVAALGMLVGAYGVLIVTGRRLRNRRIYEEAKARHIGRPHAR